MSLVSHNPKSPHHHRITLGDFVQDHLSILGIQDILAKPGWQNTLVGPHVKTCHYLSAAHHQDNAIVIFPPKARKRLQIIHQERLQSYMDDLLSGNTALVFFAQCEELPDSLKNSFWHQGLPLALSCLHINVLESRIRSIIQEKMRRCMTTHGVAIERRGSGFLISGPSGIGKTTAALQVMPAGLRWIADDRVMIQKNRDDQLLISGHPKIKKYLHTGQTGIVAVDSILTSLQIKSRAVLTAVIEVLRSDDDVASSEFIEKKILDKSLPCLRIRVPGTGYFDRNMLMEALEKLQKVG